MRRHMEGARRRRHDDEAWTQGGKPRGIDTGRKP